MVKVNGSFAPANLTIEHQPDNYTSTPYTIDNNSYRSLTGADSNNIILFGQPTIGGVQTPTIVMKRNGVYSEHHFNASDVGYITRVRVAGPDYLFFLDVNYELYRYDIAAGNWKKLNTPLLRDVCFVNSQVGYACTGNIYPQEYHFIYKTVDGGNTWTQAFAFDRFHYPYTMCTKNGKIWVAGTNQSGNSSFMPSIILNNACD